MRDLFRGLLAGAAAWKLGGGLVSTVLMFETSGIRHKY